MGKKQVPVRQGEQIEVNITGVSHTGAGIGRIAGYTVFIPFTIVGEKVLCQIAEVKKNYATAKLIKVLKPSEKRCQPACPDFFQCGGSHLQHLLYDAQLETKQKIVCDVIKRIGKLEDFNVLPTLGMNEPWAYRNKAVFQLVEQKGLIKMGFFAEETHDVISSYDCMLLPHEIRDTAGLVEEMVNKYHISLYNWKRNKGLLRHVVIRKSGAYGKVMVIFVTTGEDSLHLKTIAEELVKNPLIISVIRNINKSKGRNIFGFTNEVLAGEEVIKDKLGGLEFKISPTSFYQVNPEQTEVLYGKVKEFAGLTGEETVMDVYCGIGTITLYLSRLAKKVYGLEVHEAAIEDAIFNAKINDIDNVEFIVGRAEDKLPELVRDEVVPDVVVVDPPRKGVDKRAINVITEMGPKKVIYVSCDPASMARDLKLFEERGYKTEKVQPVDMFPQTYHVECVIGMQRKDT